MVGHVIFEIWEWKIFVGWTKTYTFDVVQPISNAEYMLGLSLYSSFFPSLS